MTLNFFTAEHGFQKSLIDPSTTVGTKKSYTTSLKREEFNTSRSKNNDLKQSEQNEEFAKMMNSLKNKTGNNDKAETVAPSEVREEVTIQNVKMALFKTEEAALPTESRTVESKTVESSTETLDTQVSLTNIVALNAEIQRLIEEQSQNRTTTGDIVITTEPKSEEVKSIFALLASFLSNKDDNKEGEPEIAFISILEKIQDVATSKDAIAITSGLTPEQLTQLQDHIQNYMNDTLAQRDQDALEALAAQWVSLTPPTKETTKNTAKVETSITAKMEPAVNTEKTHTVPQNEQRAQSQYEMRYDARYSGTNQEAQSKADHAETTNFKAALENADTKPSGKNTAQAQNNNAQSSGQRFLQASGLAAPNMASALDPSGTQSTTATAVQNAQLLQSSLTNVITQAQSATQAHPATQMVSASIQKAVKAGEDTTIRLKLDPPELGRVEVKMSIDKDNVTKIVLTAEKPETYMMLKQDAEILERALNNAGLDTDGDLSFELASEDHDFGQDSKQGHGNRQQKPNSSLDEDIIETTMDWQVDPETGRMHYNVLV
ncbi:MAG: hypothetical protein COA45_09770 [Zetaproteobacteria bacterium]|nr:MAG: hypothetical protein COA45_09770 [Zetaproteobacteria bacterium]